MLLISALNQKRSGQKPRGPHCAAADTGQGRDKLLCLDFVIHSWETRDNRDCCQECPAAPFWGTYKWASVWSWPQETPLIDCRMVHSDTVGFLSIKSKAVQKTLCMGLTTRFWILICMYKSKFWKICCCPLSVHNRNISNVRLCKYWSNEKELKSLKTTQKTNQPSS